MQGLPWACWRLTDTTGRCAVRFCNYFWGLGHGPKTTRAWPARRQTDGTSRCACSFCIYLSGSGGSPRSSPTETCKKKKRALPRPWVKGGGGAIQDADLTPASLMRKRATLFRIFDADSSPASLMRTPLPHRIFHA